MQCLDAINSHIGQLTDAYETVFSYEQDDEIHIMPLHESASYIESVIGINA